MIDFLGTFPRWHTNAVICKCSCVSCGAFSITVCTPASPISMQGCGHMTFTWQWSHFSALRTHFLTHQGFDNFIIQKTLVGSSLCFGAQTAEVLVRVSLCIRHPRPSPTVWSFDLSWHTSFRLYSCDSCTSVWTACQDPYGPFVIIILGS